MIDLKDRPDLGWNALLAVSCVGIAAALWLQFGVAISPPAPPSDLGNLSGNVARSNRNVTGYKQSMSDRTWQVSADALAPAVLDYLNTAAEKNSVQLTSFRSDRASQVATLDAEPFVAVVEGGFPDVLAFAHSFESSSSKLAVNMLELSASDTAPGHVTATFGLFGFLVREPK